MSENDEKKEFQIWKSYEYMNNINEYKDIYKFQQLNDDVVNVNQVEKLVDSPLISIIIYCNEFKYLPKTINSIENQDFIYLEIILIYDNNNDENFQLIEKYTSQFNNIKLISNNDIKGALYSISKGVLSSKGEYVLILEPGFTLAKRNTLTEIYYEASDNGYDILEFNLLINNRERITTDSLSFSLCKHVPSNLGLNSIRNKNYFLGIDQQNDILGNQLIKRNLFANLVSKYNFIDIKRKIYNYYDDIFLFLLYNDMSSFKTSEMSGIINNIKNTKSLSLYEIKNEKNQKIKDIIFYINFLFDNTIDTTEAKELVANEYIGIMNIIYNKYNKLTDESYNLYKKFMNDNNLNDQTKESLYLYYSSLKN